MSEPMETRPRRGELIVLHVGCGTYHPEKLHAQFRTPGWRELRLDADPAVAPDLVASITDMSMVPSGSVHAIWSCHNLEHVAAYEVGQALREFYRVLHPEGFALIALPDLQRVAELIAADKLDEVVYQSAAGPITPLDMLYGHRPSIAAGRTLMAHRNGFTAQSLGQALLDAGFAFVDMHRSGLDLWALASKTPRPTA